MNWGLETPMSITSGTGEFATRAIHAGYDPADYGHAAVPPIYASAAFDLENAQRGDALAGGLIDGFEYSRVANPRLMCSKSVLRHWRAVSVRWRSAQVWRPSVMR